MENELYHYGVKGMKWGVRKASKVLSGHSTKDQYYRAKNKLIGYKEKSTKELQKIQKSKSSKNQKKAKILDEQIKNIDKTLADKGKRFIESGSWKGVDRENYSYINELYRRNGIDINKYIPSKIDEYGRVTSMKYNF